MKIINESGSNLTMVESSLLRSGFGFVVLGVSALLFIVFADTPTSEMALIAYLCFALGVYILFANTPDSIELDTTAGTLTHQCTTWVFFTHRKTYPLRDVSRVIVATTRSWGNASEAFLLFTNGERLRIDREHGSMRFSLSDVRPTDTATPRTIAQRVATFLNVPLEEQTGT